MTDQADHVDVLIAGGGMVGASLAVALQPLGLRVGLVDRFQFQPAQQQPAYDDRSVALSYGSALIYQGTGLWPQLTEHAEPIRHIHVSDRGFFGAARLSAQQEKVPALGYVIQSRALGAALYAGLQAAGVKLIAPASVVEVLDNTDRLLRVRVQSVGDGEVAQDLTASLLVVADGSESDLRSALGIAARTYDYGQAAVIANVSTQRPHQNVAYERFTTSGPLALLPMTENRYSLVWTQRQQDLAAIMQLSDADFLQQLQAAFGFRQGAFVRSGQRSSYPLKLLKSQCEVQGRAVLIGNASHTLHPVAGQGLNLALRDVAVLAELLAGAVADQGGSQALFTAMPSLLAAYQHQRSADHAAAVQYTDGLVRLFSADIPGLGHGRAGGLLVLDRLPWLKRQLARQSMGLRFQQSRLGRGLALR